MEKRRIGNTDLEAYPLAFGGNVFGWTVDEASSFTLLDAFVDAGFNLVDTADIYSTWVPGNAGGESETIIGKWLQRSGRRGEVLIATKVGMEMAPDKKGLSSKYIVQAVENSLKRLQTDYIDLYQSHTDDADTPLEETLAAYAALVEQGKVRAVGASNYKADRLASALHTSEQHGYPAYQCLQPEYNLHDRAGYEAELEPLCREKGLGVIPYYSLASGFLSGKYRSEADLSKSPRGRGIRKYLTDRGTRILGALDQLAKGYGSTPAGIALAWLMARPGITAPIASATNLAQLKELTDAANLRLNVAAIELLDNASAP